MTAFLPGTTVLRSRYRRGALIVVIALAITGLAACHETGSVQVKSLSFSGVKAFPTSELTRVLATRQSGWLPWSAKHYFDRAEFDADLARIHAFYADRGYPAQRVTAVHVDVSDDHTSVRLRIEIDEGAPVIVEAVRFEGFDVLPESARSQVDNVPLKAGGPRDRDRVRASRDAVAALLRDNGYPEGYVSAGERPGETAGQVLVTFRADPGPVMKFGEVTVDGLTAVDAAVVRRQLAFRPGDEYRESRVLATQRRLSSLELFELVSVTPRLETAEGGRVPMRVTVAEAKPRRLQLAVGYGTEERLRGALNWKHLNFMGGARQLNVDAHASYLEQGLEVSLIEPHLGRPRWSLDLTGLVLRERQLTYDSQAYGGRVTVNYRARTGLGGSRQGTRYEAHVGYGAEYFRYGILQESLDDLSLREERIALGLDPDTGRGEGVLGSVNFDARRVAVDDALRPTRGTIVSFHLEHAAPWLGGTYRFDDAMVDGRLFAPLGSSVLALRASFGSVSAGDPSTFPFSQRYFLGGAASLRGWGRFQVSPLDEQGLPVGGRTMVELSSELRFPVRGKLTGVAFVDAGNVVASGLSADDLQQLRVNIGPGLRYETPIGALRADLGVQLTPIDGLVVNGAPETRRWRLHLGIGHAF